MQESNRITKIYKLLDSLVVDRETAVADAAQPPTVYHIAFPVLCDMYTGNPV